MANDPTYHDGMRQLQDARETRGIADRLAQVTLRAEFTDEAIFPNCPRYLHKMQLVEHSVYAPKAGHTPPVPAWKIFEVFRDDLPARDRPEPGGDDKDRG
jgi:hypothetical protein